MTLGRLGGCWPKRVCQVEAKPFTRCSCSRKSDLVTVFVLLVVFGPANEPLGGLLHLRQCGGHTLHSLRMTTCLGFGGFAGSGGFADPLVIGGFGNNIFPNFSC